MSPSVSTLVWEVNMFRALKAASAGCLMLLPASALAAVIDFDALDASAAQTTPLTSFTEDGYTFSLSYTGPSLGPAIFDTTCTGYGGADGCNGDPDLQPLGGQGTDGVAGNVMILQDERYSVPNDNADGGEIFLTLVSGTPFRLTGFSAVDDEEMFSAIDTDGSTVLATVGGGVDGGTEAATTFSSVVGIGDTISFRFGGSGGIDSLLLEEVTPVPVPATLPLALGAFGALGLLARRRRPID